MATIEEVRSKVGRILGSNFQTTIDGDGEFYIAQGSAGVWVSVQEGFRDHVQVRLRAMLIGEVTVTPELTLDIATTGLLVGSLFLWIDDESKMGTVWNTWSLLGDYLDEEELCQAVAAIVISTDQMDDDWKAKHGGRLHNENA